MDLNDDLCKTAPWRCCRLTGMILHKSSRAQILVPDKLREVKARRIYIDAALIDYKLMICPFTNNKKSLSPSRNFHIFRYEHYNHVYLLRRNHCDALRRRKKAVLICAKIETQTPEYTRGLRGLHY